MGPLPLAAAPVSLLRKPRRVCAYRRKSNKSVFRGDMRVAENTSQPASVEFIR